MKMLTFEDEHNKIICINPNLISTVQHSAINKDLCLIHMNNGTAYRVKSKLKDIIKEIESI